MMRSAGETGVRSRPARWLAGLGCLALLAVLAQGAPGVFAAGVEKGSGDFEKVDLNRASEEELMTVPGIGKTTAGRIVAFRDEHGPFERVEDLLKIKGIGEKSFQKLSAYVKVSRRKK
jgi:competence protein ComEA